MKLSFALLVTSLLSGVELFGQNSDSLNVKDEGIMTPFSGSASTLYVRFTSSPRTIKHFKYPIREILRAE